MGARPVAMDAYLQLLCADSLVAMDLQLTLQSGARPLACDSKRHGNILWVHDAVRLLPPRRCHGCARIDTEIDSFHSINSWSLVFNDSSPNR